jgi:hypothetical protein
MTDSSYSVRERGEERKMGSNKQWHNSEMAVGTGAARISTKGRLKMIYNVSQQYAT